MPVHIRISGAWKEVDVPHLKPITGGGAWRAISQIYVRVAGAWKEVLGGLVVTLDTADVFNGGGGDVHAGITYFGATNIHENSCTATGVYTTSRGNWLDEGVAGDVWVERSIDSGSLTFDDIGSGRVRMNVSRKVEVVRFSGDGIGTKACTLTISMYDAASGGNLLDSEQNILTAQKFF